MVSTVWNQSAEALLNSLQGSSRILKKSPGESCPRPGSIPSLVGVEVYGETLPLNGIVGGDHLIYVDFKKRHDLEARIKVAEDAGRPDIAASLDRCRSTAGVALIDVSGHQATDAMLAAMFHQAFLLGILYELDMSGHVTQRLFENLNQRFYRTSKVDKFITAVYGEISEDATFRFLLAGHPSPIVFSAANDRFMEVDREKCISFPPLGTFPSKSVVDWHRSKSVLGFKEPYEVNKWTLMGSGDILLLYTDGLQEHKRGDDPYLPRSPGAYHSWSETSLRHRHRPHGPRRPTNVCKPCRRCEPRRHQEALIKRMDPKSFLRRPIRVSGFVLSVSGLIRSLSASAAILPSALFGERFRSVQVGRPQVQRVLLLRIDLGSHLLDGSRTRTWAQSPELGG